MRQTTGMGHKPPFLTVVTVSLSSVLQFAQPTVEGRNERPNEVSSALCVCPPVSRRSQGSASPVDAGLKGIAEALPPSATPLAETPALLFGTDKSQIPTASVELAFVG